MAKRAKGLTAQSVKTLKAAGMYADGGGLYLNIKASGAKSWMFRYTFAGKRREKGLGGYPLLSLAEAREKAEVEAKRVFNGMDPLDLPEEELPPKIPTFGEMAQWHIAAMAGGWKNAKHKAQWKTTLADHAKLLTDKPVDQIAVAEVLEVLKPIWQKVPETASRVRGRIEAVLDAAKAAGHRKGENPAAWKGNLKHLLSARKKLSRGHHAALSFAEVPAFVAKLHMRPGASAIQLEFLILNASRSSEVRLATWPEIDFAEKLWVVPADRMKMVVEHRVPLAPRSIEILEGIKERQEVEAHEAGLQWNARGYIFTRSGTTLAPSINATEMLLRRMKMEVTTHGFRSSFRDWVGDATNFDGDLAEMQLAHKVGDETELAYRRGDALRKRRAMMETWALYCAGQHGKVLPMARAEQGPV